MKIPRDEKRKYFLPEAPIIVFNDADLTSAVNGVAFASFVASGQTCVSGTRIIIQDQIYDKFMVQFLKKVNSIGEGMGSRAFYNYNST
jgi:acyl-CoA reductase-like NAD-dependent aldehyde dehydrogenase